MVYWMLNIAIFGKERSAQFLKDSIIRYNIQSNKDNRITIFYTLEDLIKVFCSKCDYDILFVDLDKSENDIFQIMSHIRHFLLNEEIAIIVLSSSEYCQANLIKFHIFDYIYNPVEYTELSECLNNYIKIKRLSNSMFQYIRHKSVFEIAVAHIIFFESKGKKIIIHTVNQKFEFYGRLSECLKQKCIKDFIDIHQSFLVNPVHIKSREHNFLIVTGNIKLPISRNKMKNIRY